MAIKPGVLRGFMGEFKVVRGEYPTVKVLPGGVVFPSLYQWFSEETVELRAIANDREFYTVALCNHPDGSVTYEIFMGLPGMYDWDIENDVMPLASIRAQWENELTLHDLRRFAMYYDETFERIREEVRRAMEELKACPYSAS